MTNKIAGLPAGLRSDGPSATLDHFSDDARAAILAKHRANLMPAADRAELEATYGKVIGPLIDAKLEAKLEAKARELVDRYQEAWVAAFTQINGDATPREELLCTREDAAKMLSVSLSTVKRMETDGLLPDPIAVGERGVRHRLIDIEKLARFRGAPRVPHD